MMNAVTPGDRRLQQRAADVVADGIRDPAQGPLDALGVLRSLHSDEALDPSGPGGHHEDAQDQDRHPGEDRADQPEADVAQHLRRRRPALLGSLFASSESFWVMSYFSLRSLSVLFLWT